MAVSVIARSPRRDGVRFRIDDDRTVADRRHLRQRGALRAPEQRAGAGHQLVRAEGLGDVVVRAELEPDDAIGFLRARREHDDGNGVRFRVGADRAADFEAVDLRQHQVEDEQVGWMGGDGRQRVAARRNHLRREACLAQIARDEISDIPVVFHDEHSGGHRAPFYWR